MAFEYPEYLKFYLDKKGKSPFQSFVNTSQYYANVDSFMITYLNHVVRQCMAYANATHDGAYNLGISANVGFNAVKTATKLVKGDKTIFNGDDYACQFLSDEWSGYARFDLFLEQAINNMLAGGTTLVKINKDNYDRCSLSSSRVDRNYFTTNDAGDVVDAIFLLTLLSSTKNDNIDMQYWLVEHRYYEHQEPKVVYKVHRKDGMAGNEGLPLLYGDGIVYEQLPEEARISIDRMGIKLNEAEVLPFRDGLGVWAWVSTANNSCVPGLRMGDPLLYGVLDLLWALDTVFSGSIIDVLNGKGVILLPRTFAQTINEELAKLPTGTAKLVTREDLVPPSDNMVYIQVKGEENFKPESVQFDIRSEQYGGMWELYLKQIAVTIGFAPTTLFPYLQDNSPKTATEVTAEENLTRATVQSVHRLIIPELNRAIAEVLFQAGFAGKATVQLSDYIGNKILRDKNVRENYLAGLIPRSVAIQQISGVDAKETAEYEEKIDADEKRRTFGQAPFNDSDYFGGNEL